MMCDFNRGFQPPEMTKCRPVITISKKRNDGTPLCTIVPISSSRPDVIRNYHYLLPSEALPKHLRGKYPESWIKADMLTTVSFSRLNLFWNKKDNNGKRVYQTGAIDIEHRIEVSSCISSYLHLLELKND